MFSFEFDADAAVAHNNRNERAVMQFAERAYEHVKKAAEATRNRHRYKRQTGHAELNTVVKGQPTGGDMDVDLVAAFEYASYLEKHGWMTFERNAETAKRHIDQAEITRLAEAAQG